MKNKVYQCVIQSNDQLFNPIKAQNILSSPYFSYNYNCCASLKLGGQGPFHWKQQAQLPLYPLYSSGAQRTKLWGWALDKQHSGVRCSVLEN